MGRKQSGSTRGVEQGAERIRGELVRIDDVLTNAMASGNDGQGLARLRARLLDELLRNHFAEVCAAKGTDMESAPVTLAAVGSYGRSVMGLRSDIDVRLLASACTPSVRAFADAFLYPLWDAGISVGHQLATPSELLALAKDDLATATMLLDLRCVTGDSRPVRDLVAKFAVRIASGVRASRFVHALAEDSRKRRERYGDSVYLLEPEIKLGAGGLRDLDVARWVLTSRADEITRDPHDVEAVTSAEAFAWRVRNRLHALAKRRSDRLTFDAQEELARSLGYVTADGDDAREEGTERFMQDHYVHARAISRMYDRAMSLATPTHARGKARRDIGGGLVLVGGAVAIGDIASMTQDPPLALRVYEACVRLEAPIDQASRDAIATAASDLEWCARLRSSPDAAALFVALICAVAESPTLGASVPRELHDVGLLLAMIPEFLPVTGRVHHDVYHVLTVDVHSVAAVDCLRGLARGELLTAHPLASRLAAEVVRPRALFLATLLHDVGKGQGRGGRKNHSVNGAELCHVVLPRLGFTAEETADASSLVLNHLAMYHLATRRDLDDASTVEELCRIVRGCEGLRDLYLLTIADITTTSPSAMTSWKAYMLEELFLRADAQLAGTPALIDAERMASALAEVAQHDAHAAQFVASMPVRYVLGTKPLSIATHARVARERGAKSVAVGLGPSHARSDCEVCVVARDRHGLLARIAAALASSGLDVSAAHINTRTSENGREAVDVFFVRDPAGGPEAVARKMAAFERDLVELCDDRVSPNALVARRLGARASWAVRKTPDVRTRIVFDERTSPHSTIIEVITKDEVGLLFRLASALEAASLSIVLSKINTEGTKVADVFYVQELDGRKVEGKVRLEDIRDRLIAATR